MSLYPPYIDRHASFAAPVDTRWQRSCSSELSHWQTTSRTSVQQQQPDLPTFYRPEQFLDSSYVPLIPSYLETSRSYIAPTYSPSLSAVSSLSKQSSTDNWGNTLYHMEDDAESSDSHPSPAVPKHNLPAVKAEPQDSFIMELRGSCSGGFEQQAPSNKVPLRATHACGEMLSMMGVFRLNPFIVGGAAYRPQENTGLDRSPIMFEFTVELPEDSECEEVWLQEEEEMQSDDLPDLGYPDREQHFTNHDSLYSRNSYPDWSLGDRERVYSRGY